MLIDDNLLAKDEYTTYFPRYEGIGVYVAEVPESNYLIAHLDAPNAPENMICQIRYYSHVYKKLGNQNYTTILGNEQIFRSGTQTSSKYIYYHTDMWKSLITVHFIVPNNIDNFRDLHVNNKYVYPGKDWKLTLSFEKN